MTLYAESAADKTNDFADAFVRDNVVHGYDVRKFTVKGILLKRNSV